MHTRNVNVKTAAQESTGRCDSNLTTSQFTDLFCWVLAATEGSHNRQFLRRQKMPLS